MKNIFIIFCLAFSLAACKQSTSESKINPDTEQVYSISTLLLDAENQIDKDIKIKAFVEHVCSHSGRRCFLVDSLSDESVKVEAAGDIESFGKELLGKEIIVTGIVKEERVELTEIDELEAELVAKHGDIENGGEHCTSEMANIVGMREWMKNNDKDYYAIYYLEGQSYEIAQ